MSLDVIFEHTVLGQHGVPFVRYKVRTMQRYAESLEPTLATTRGYD